MAKYVFCCPQLSFLSMEKLVSLLLSERHRPLLEYYRHSLEDDPDYFRFQFELKLHDMPELQIVACNGPDGEGCCIIDALEEAIRRSLAEKHAATAA